LKGFKYNADLLQLITLPLVVLAYLDAFEKRTITLRHLARTRGALALMTKYWVLTMIGAIGLAALIHPARMLFLRSPAPWSRRDIGSRDGPALNLAEAGEFLSVQVSRRYLFDIKSHSEPGIVLGYIAITLLCSRCRWWSPPWRWRGARAVDVAAGRSRAFVTQLWSRDANSDVHQARNIWIVQGIVAVGPLIGALLFSIYLKTDWGISLFFLTPLAVVAIPQLRLRRPRWYESLRPG